MQTRLRQVLAPTVTMLLILQSLMPGVWAENEAMVQNADSAAPTEVVEESPTVPATEVPDPVVTEEPTEPVVPDEVNNTTEPEAPEENDPVTPPQEDPVVETEPDPVPVWLDNPVLTEATYKNATCDTPPFLNLQTLREHWAVEKVEISDEWGNVNHNFVLENAAGTTFWIKVTFIENHVLDANSYWEWNAGPEENEALIKIQFGPAPTDADCTTYLTLPTPTATTEGDVSEVGVDDISEIDGVASVEIEGNVVAGDDVTVRVGFDHRFGVDPVTSPGWEPQADLTATYILTIPSADESDSDEGSTEGDGSTEDGESEGEDSSEEGDLPEVDNEEGAEGVIASPTAEIENDGDGADSTPTAEVVGTPSAELTSVSLPAPVVVDPDEAGDKTEVQTEEIEAVQGVELVTVEETEAEPVVQGPSLMAASVSDEPEEQTLLVRARFEEGSEFDAENSDEGWEEKEDGSAVFAVPLVISPMSVDTGLSWIDNFSMELVAPDLDDPNRLTHHENDDFILSFDYHVEAPEDGQLEAGDSYSFTIAGWDQIGVEVPADDPIPLMDPNGDVQIGIAYITADGEVTLEFNEEVNGEHFVDGDVFIQITDQWAENLVQQDDVDVTFSAETQSGTSTSTFTIPGDPDAGPPAPGTEPTKEGSFTEEDQGRVVHDGAILWTIRAPMGGPTDQVVMTDIIPGYTDGTHNWDFDCESIVEIGTSALADDGDIEVDCTVPGQITVTITNYDASTAGEAPGITILANVINSENSEETPNAENLIFSNTISSVTTHNDDVLNPGGTEASVDLPQHIIGDGNDPVKWGEWATDDEGRTRNGEGHAESAILWTFRAPSGPVDSVTLTDTAPDGTVFVCGETNSGVVQTSGVTATSITCEDGLLTIVLPGYDNFRPSELPTFTVYSSVITPQPGGPRETLDPITNVVTADTVLPGGAEYQGWDDATVEQTVPPVPATEADKFGTFTRRDRGEYNQDEALKWTITLPEGPNHQVIVTEEETSQWSISLDGDGVCLTNVDVSGVTQWTADNPLAPDTISADLYTDLYTIDCQGGVLTVNFPSGYASGTPVITVTADIEVEFEPGRELTNQVKVEVLDYLNDPNFSEDYWTTTTADATATQQRFQGGTGTRGQRGVFKVSIGNYVWFDQNRNGVQDDDELPVPGVTVRLLELNDDGVWVQDNTATTDANGFYYFQGLDSDWQYRLEFDLPETFDGQPIGGWTTQGTSNNNSNAPGAWSDSDSDVDVNGVVEFWTPSVGGNGYPGKTDGNETLDNPTLDAGIVLPWISVGDYVWFDHNRDGLQGDPAFEIPLVGEEVRLYEEGATEPIAITHTDGTGYYFFNNLEPSTNYFIEFVQPDFVDEFTSPNVSGGTTDPLSTDSKAVDITTANGVTTGRTPVFTTPEDGDNLTAAGESDMPQWDAGFISNHVSIGDYVWFDSNRNGIQEAGELPVVGVTVELLNADGSSTGRTTTTNSAGYYYFKDLDHSTSYQVQFNADAAENVGDYEWTLRDEGGDGLDSDVDADGYSHTFETFEFGYNMPWGDTYIPDNADDPTIDAGLVKYVSIGDRVWFDADRDGVQDDPAVEFGLEGVTVALVDQSGNPVLDRNGDVIPSTTTDANGNYSFTDLVADQPYRLVFTMPTNHPDGRPFESWTIANVGDDTLDSDVDPATGIVDFNAPSFGDNLAHGEETNPDNPSFDAGVILPMASIGDYVWFDYNRDGIQDGSETPVANVPVALLDGDGNPVLDEGGDARTTTTDANGFYVFTDLEPGTDYQVQFTVPSNYDGWTLQNQEENDEVDSDVNPDTGVSDVVTTPTALDELTNSDTTPDVPTVDAGLVINTVSVGDYVWYDADLDGIQDDGETPADEVTVTISGPDGFSDSTETDENGFYWFNGLTPETEYTLTFTAPDGYIWTLLQQGEDVTEDSDVVVDNEQDAVGTITFTSEEFGWDKPWDGETYNGGSFAADNPRLDGGLINLVSIGDYVWFDYDQDGVQGTHEREFPIEGVVVQLFESDGETPVYEADGTTPRTTTTNGSGFYSFDNLYPGRDYVLVFDTPGEGSLSDFDGWTEQDAGGNNALDSDVNPEGRIPFTAPTEGSNSATDPDDSSYDAGVIINTVSIGDYVWYDTNLNGVQDADEAPVEGVQVDFLGENGREYTATTDSNGYYFFTGLAPNTGYTLTFTGPEGYTWTQVDAEDDDAADSDVVATTPNGRIGTITGVTTPPYGADMPWGDTYDPETGLADDPTQDGGLVQLVSVGDYVWFDYDRDGVQDADESGIADIPVTLYKLEGEDWVQVGNPIETDSNGYYGFANLYPGDDYRVEFEKPADYDAWTAPNVGEDDAADSDAIEDADGNSYIEFTAPDNSEPRTNLITPGDADDPTLDAGLVIETVSVGDYVWYDTDLDGIQDEDELPAEVTVTITGPDGFSDSTTTNANGFYWFTGLTPLTDYTLTFTAPDGYAWTQMNAGGDDDVDSDVVVTIPTASVGTIDFTSEEFGFNKPWTDETYNGTTVAADNPTLDGGLVKMVSVGDYVWFDYDKDGEQGGEKDEPVGGVEVRLLDAEGNPVLDESGNPRTTNTAPNGFYSFNDLYPDTEYIIEFELPENYDGWTTPNASESAEDAHDGTNDSKVITEIDGAGDGRTHVLTTPPTGDNSLEAPDKSTLDAGLVIDYVSIGDYVWLDENVDGIQDDSEPAVPGVVVHLLDAEGNPVLDASGAERTATTDANGYYWFTDLEPDSAYQLQFVQSDPNLTWTLQDKGDDDAADSDVNADGQVSFTSPTLGKNLPWGDDSGALVTDNPRLDAGLVRMVSVGDYVWYDADRDGIQDEDELPIAEVVVILYDEEGNEVDRTETIGTGFYAFNNLYPNTPYSIQFEKPDDYTQWTIQGDDENVDTRGLDSNVNPTGSASFTSQPTGNNLITEGETDDPTVDAGLVKLISIGDKVWDDENRDGIQDPEEPGVPGVVVIIYGPDGEEVDRTETDPDGYYNFDNLYPSTEYEIEFQKPDGYAGWTEQGDLEADPDNPSDSNVDPSTGRTTVTTTDSGSNQDTPEDADNPTIDAGLIRLISVGDYVWYDYDRDGVQDEGETPVPGVNVTITGPDGFTATDTTDETGFYEFLNLIPETEYTITFELPEGYTEWTTPNAGEDAAVDSNVDESGVYTFTTPKHGNNLSGPDNTDDPTIDAGVVIKVSVGDTVWDDEDRDGVQDPGEPGVPGVTVIIYGPDGEEVDRTTTDPNGNYNFPDLYPNTEYEIEFQKPDGYAGWTTPNTGDDDGLDSDPDRSGRVKFTTPETGTNLTTPGDADDPTIDAGLVRLISVGDYVWYDADRDGVQDEDESPVAGVTVTITHPDGTTTSTVTDENGYYYFENLIPETEYTITFEKPDGYTQWTTPNSGDDAGADSNVDAGGTYTFTTPKHGNNLTGPDATDDPTIDAGLVNLISVGDYVWFDEDGDGIQDPEEPAAPGIVVHIYQGEKIVGTTTTDENGYYAFKDLFPNTEYTIVFEKPDGYSWTQLGAGNDPGADSDANPFGVITFTTPASGSNMTDPGMADNPTLDAGLVVRVDPDPEKDPSPVTKLPSTGSGSEGNALELMLATVAGLMAAAVALRMNAFKRS